MSNSVRTVSRHRLIQMLFACLVSLVLSRPTIAVPAEQPEQAAEASTEAAAAPAKEQQLRTENYISPWKQAAPSAKPAEQDNASAQHNATMRDEKRTHLKYDIKNRSGGASMSYDLLKF